MGTFLVAGVWLLWKNELPDLKEVVLDSEIGARRFYESVGFHTRGLSSFALGLPKGYLLRAILSMANRCPNLKQNAAAEIREIIRKEIKALRKRPKGEKALSERKALLAAVDECLEEDARPDFAEAAIQSLRNYQSKIPEAKEIIQSITGLPRKGRKVNQAYATGSRP